MDMVAEEDMVEGMEEAMVDTAWAMVDHMVEDMVGTVEGMEDTAGTEDMEEALVVMGEATVDTEEAMVAGMEDTEEAMAVTEVVPTDIRICTVDINTL